MTATTTSNYIGDAMNATAVLLACSSPQRWAFPDFRCRHQGMTRTRMRSSPARPYMERLMSLSLLMLPPTGPVFHGRVSAARTASTSRDTPRANEASLLAAASASQGSRARYHVLQA